MIFESKSAAARKEILANDHYVAIPYDCSDVTDTNGVIPAGTIVPANDATAVGVLLCDVVKANNPNGTVVVHGFVRESKLPTAPEETAKTALGLIKFM